jgi:hypothetical protein
VKFAVGGAGSRAVTLIPCSRSSSRRGRASRSATGSSHRGRSRRRRSGPRARRGSSSGSPSTGVMVVSDGNGSPGLSLERGLGQGSHPTPRACRPADRGRWRGAAAQPATMHSQPAATAAVSDPTRVSSGILATSSFARPLRRPVRSRRLRHRPRCRHASGTRPCTAPPAPRHRRSWCTWRGHGSGPRRRGCGC